MIKEIVSSVEHSGSIRVTRFVVVADTSKFSSHDLQHCYHSCIAFTIHAIAPGLLRYSSVHSQPHGYTQETPMHEIHRAAVSTLPSLVDVQVRGIHTVLRESGQNQPFTGKLASCYG
jgi:hypothetical protein